MDKKEQYIRDRIASINDNIDTEIEFLNLAAYEDYHFEVSNAKIEGLKHERAKLKQMLD